MAKNYTFSNHLLFYRTQKPCIVDALRRGMTPKKVHEVEEFSKCIHDNVGDGTSCLLVDVGSGLGYVGQVTVDSRTE